MELIVFPDNPLILLLEGLVVECVVGDLTLQALVDLLQLLEALGGLQQVVQQLLGQG